MPSIQQINQQTPSGNTTAKRQPSALYKYLKLIVAATIAVLAYKYYTSAKIVKIPDSAYTMSNNSYFKELFTSPYRKLIWFGANCPLSAQKKSIIDRLMKASQLDKYYIHHPFLQNSLVIAPTDELGNFIMKHCSNEVCIIAPSLHKIVKTSNEKMFRDMEKFINDQSWN